MKEIINLRIGNGHTIWIIKGERGGYKYFGKYKKPTKKKIK